MTKENFAKIQGEELIVRTREVEEDRGSNHKADLCARELRKWSDNNKILPLKQLSDIGDLSHLRYILPVSRYSSDFVRKLAKNTACRIILRELRESVDDDSLPDTEKKKCIDLLVSMDPKYKYLKKFELKDSKIQAVLYDILAQENKELTAQRLGEIFAESDKYTRATAVKIIAEILQNTQTNLLIKLLRDPDSRVRANVIEALEYVGNPNVVGILLRYKMDRDERVRANTLKALWNLGYRDIENALSDMLFDQNTSMQTSGIWVIGEIGHNEPSIKKLLRIVEHEEDPAIRLKVLQAKRKIKLREKGLRVLVIDDDKDFLKSFFYKLARDGFHILAAFDGESGIKSSSQQMPDLILVNCELPDISGIDITKKLRNGGAARHIPVVMMLAGSPQKETADRIKDGGAHSHLVKPFEYEDFLEAVQDIFDI